ncbi:MAG: ATP-binding protein, partial [archaeon]
ALEIFASHAATAISNIRSREESDGTGLGLGFVRALVESYGGSVCERDASTGGADFRVTLDRV